MYANYMLIRYYVHIQNFALKFKTMAGKSAKKS